MRTNIPQRAGFFLTLRARGHLQPSGWLLLGVTTAYMVLYFIWFLLLQTNTASNTDIGNLFPLPLNLGGTVLAWRIATRQYNHVRIQWAWTAFAVSLLLMLAGNVLYLAYEWNGGTAPFPSLCDALYLMGYVFMIIGLVSFGSLQQSNLNRIPFWLDFSVVAVGTSMALWAFVLEPIFAVQPPSLLEGVVAFGYPIGDILILFGIFTVLLRRPPATSALAVNLLILAFFITAIADLIYLRQALDNTYQSGTWLDSSWMVYYLFAMWAAVVQFYRLPMALEATPAPQSPRIWLPYPAMLVGYSSLFVVAASILTSKIGVMIMCSVGLTSLVITRQIIAVRADLATQAKASAVAADLDRAHADLARQRVELALHQSEAGRRALFDALPDTVLWLNPAGVILEARVAQDDTLGLSQRNLRGTMLTTLFVPIASERLLVQIAQTVDSRAGQVAEYKRATITGRDIEARTFLNAEEVVMIIRDISERARVEQLKNEFVSIVSHELRTPLTSIRGSLGLISGGVTGEIPEQARQMIGIAHANSERLVRLINDILDIQKIEAGAMTLHVQPLHLQSLIERTIADNTAFAAQFNVTLALHSASEAVWVQADVDRLVQVFTNVISNAVKFSPAHAVVAIHVRREGNKACVAISDCGPGIPEAFHSQLFHKFAQADSSDSRRKTGSGLGLSIAKALIEQFAGTISFTSTLGCGTTFVVSLPEYAHDG